MTSRPTPASLPRPPAPGATDFDTVAAEYDESLPRHVIEHYLAKRLAFIRDHTQPGPTLDVGCGTGLLAERVAAAGYEVTALDVSRGMLAELRRRVPTMRTVAANGTSLPFAEDSFRLTYCVAVLHHIAEPDAVRTTLTEMVRVTRQGGHILIWDHNPRNPYWPLLMRRVPQDTGSERLIPEHEIVTGLESGGATVLGSAQLGLVPDFVPPRVLRLASVAERVVESIPGLRRLCAHNIVLATK